MATSPSRLGRRFWTLFCASAMSSLAAGVTVVSLPLLAASLTREPLLLSLLASITFLPWLLFALVSGAIIDRVDRRVAMIATNACRVVILAGLTIAILTDRTAIWLLYLVALLVGTTEVLYDGAARAMLPSLVRRDQLDAANGPLSATETAARGFLGAPLGSVLFVLAAAAPFLGASVAYLGAALLLLLLLPGNYSNYRRERRQTLIREMTEGVRWLWRHRLLRGITVLNALSTVPFFAATSLLVLYVLEVLALGEVYYGLYALAIGAGGIIAALLAPILLRRWSRSTLLVAGAAAFGIMFGTAGAFPHPITTAVLFVVAGGWAQCRSTCSP